MNKILGILNLIIMIACCSLLNVSINRLIKISEETLKYQQPEAIRVIADEKFILDKEL